jgi:hypothetical protein
MQLANETVIATCLRASGAFSSSWCRYGRRTIGWSVDSPMLVRGFDCGSV